ncbi:MAG TPA: CoA transferase, partial [Dehalococcoidia bacterium]|nr:CoA transferase [Dehalococcoidia bacterium]
RVIDVVGEIGLYAAKVLVELGAEVIRVERPEGDPVRARSPRIHAAGDPDGSLYAAHYHAGKRSVTLDLARPADRERLIALLTDADVLLESFARSDLAQLGLEWPALHALNPRLIVASITPFGRTGPWADFQGTDLTGLASGGILYLTGEPDRPPVRIAGEAAYHFAGLHGAIGTLLALIARTTTGRGQHVDVSMQEAVLASYLDNGAGYYQMGRPVPRRAGTQHIYVTPFKALPCADGYFHWGATLPHQWQAILDWLGDEGVDVAPLRDPALIAYAGRWPHKDTINRLLTEFGRERTKADLFAEAQRRRITATPVQTPADLIADPHLKERGFFTEVDHPGLGRAFRDLGSPCRLSETPAAAGGSVPKLGEHNGAILDRPRPARPAAPGSPVEVRRSGRRDGSAGARALDGLRVLDFTWAVAGPLITRVLAAHGAEVIKVESGQRVFGQRTMAGPNIEASALFCTVNAGKRSITLDFGRPEAVDLLKRLAAISDVVIDNFTPDVLPKVGLGYDVLWQINPEIIQLSLPGFGSTGPYRGYRSYGPNIMSVAGLTHLTGYPDGPPSGVTFGFGDYVGGYAGLAALLAALHLRDRTGRGQRVEIAQFEASLAFLGPAILELTATGREPARQGNRDRDAVPHGVYPCAGDDRWCAIAVTSDAQWRSLAQVIGRPDLAADESLATLEGRRTREVDLDAAIADWTRSRSAMDVMVACQGAGVPAAAVEDDADLLERDPQIAARGYFERIDHSYLPEVRVDGVTVKLSETPGGYQRAGG